ncbi:MAG: hypothetical protein L0I76_13100 [Pseudonocardia sp.]|nr:hypothetical protein [Pseudonocardia sp.]
MSTEKDERNQSVELNPETVAELDVDDGSVQGDRARFTYGPGDCTNDCGGLDTLGPLCW